MVFSSNSSASINFDEDESDTRLIPIDWTPTTGYKNESIRRIALPRPAAGEAFCAIVWRRTFFQKLKMFNSKSCVRIWKSSWAVSHIECQCIGLLLFVHWKCWLQSFTTQSNGNATNQWLWHAGQHGQRNSHCYPTKNLHHIVSCAKSTHFKPAMLLSKRDETRLFPVFHFYFHSFYSRLNFENLKTKFKTLLLFDFSYRFQVLTHER